MSKKPSKKPLLVLVHSPSFLRRWMERVRFISKPWDAIFIGRNVATVLAKEGTDEASYE